MKTNILLISSLYFILIYSNAMCQPGGLDTTFNPGTGAIDKIWTIAIQNDGKILIGGKFTFYNGISRNHIARLNSDGTLDLTFDIGAGTDNDVTSIAIQNDGKILVGGIFTKYNNINRNAIVRLNSNGLLDSTFNAFNVGGGVNSISIQSDGKIISAGTFLKRLNSNGSVDPTFIDVGMVMISVSALQSDGKIIIGGIFTSYNGTSINHIARINTDGSLDTTFHVGAGTGDPVYEIAIQTDNKIIITGDFTYYNGTLRNYIARLNINGSIDASFNPGPFSYIGPLCIQSDGKIVIGGANSDNIVRLKTDGTTDLTFNPVNGANSAVSSMALQSDGKILIGGWFTSYDGVNRNRIARIYGGSGNDINSIFESKILVFPNPSSDYINIKTEKKLLNIVIYNVIGEKVFVRSSSSEYSTNDEETVDVSMLKDGVYFMHIRSENEYAVQKIIINK